MTTITLTDGTVIDAPNGKRLVLAIEDGGVDIMHQCGGNARCTTCRVHILEGEPQRMSAAEKNRLESRGLLGEVRLSCQILCFQDLTLEVINHVSTSGERDAGPRPADNVTPFPTWLTKP
jgi:ferredoxin